MPRPAMSSRRRSGTGGDDGAGEERGQSGEERMSATEAVTEAACREEQPGEHDGVRGDDPLQLGGARPEVADQAWHGDVDDGVVDGGDEQGEDEHAEDAPPVGVAGVSVAEGLGGGTTVHDDSLVWCEWIGLVCRVCRALREQAGDLVDDDAGLVDLDVVTGVVDRHQAGVGRQRHPGLLSLVPRIVEAFDL